MIQNAKYFYPLVLLVVLASTAFSQSPTCNIAAIRAAFAAQGHYVELNGVVGQPCSLYFINTNSQDAAQSEVEAQALGCHTAVFVDAAENNAVINAINAQGFGGAIWIGYRRTATGSPTFYALDGTSGNFAVPGPNATYQNWAGGEPNNNGYNGCTFGCTTFCSNTYRCQNGEQCVQIYADGRWNDLPCNSASISLVEVNLCPETTASTSQTICLGQTANLTTSNTLVGSSPYTYAWTPTPDLATPNTQNTTATPTTTSVYTVTTTDRYACTGTSTSTVNVNTAAANAGTDVAICAGASTTLNATAGGTSYAWSPATGLSSAAISNPVATPAATTTYTVTITSANGCSATDAVTVTVNPLPNANAGADAAICFNGSAFLNASGAGPTGSYLWAANPELSSTTINNPVATPTATATYNLTVTDANGCVQTDAITITVNPLPTANAGLDQAICIGASANLSALGGVSYAWTPTTSLNDNTLQSPTATPAVTTTYTVTVTDANSCTATDAVDITVNPLPLADAGPDVSACAGLPSPLLASGGTTYLWTPAAGLSSVSVNNPNATPVATTNYTVTVTDAIGCINTDDVLVTVNALPVANAGNDATICETGSVFFNASGAGAGGNYAWTPISDLSDPTLPNPVASPNANITYTLVVTDINNCQGTDDIIITVNSSPTPSVGIDQAICVGASANLSANAGYVSYGWTPNGTLSSTNTANTLATPAATTTYTVTVTDGNGCNGTDEVVVTVNALPTANAGNDVGICVGATTTLDANGGVDFSWSPGVGLSATNVFNPGANPTTTTTYTVTATDANGCVNTDDVIVTVNPLPSADAGLNVTICFGTSTTLTANTGFSTYAWTPTTALLGPNTISPVASPAGTITYTVTVTDANGCQDDDVVVVTVAPPPATYAGLDETICLGESVNMQGNGNGTTYAWTPSTDLTNATILNPIATPTSTTTYTLTVTDANNCSATDEMVITVNPLPTVLFTAFERCLNLPTSFSSALSSISSGNIIGYDWVLGDGTGTSTDPNPVYTYTAANSYTVSLTLTSDQGCTNVGTMAVNVFPLPVVSFAANTQGGCAPTTISFAGNSSVATGSIVSQTWDFGNGETATQNAPLFPPLDQTYNTAANYTVSLTAVSDNNCSTTTILSDYITINPRPNAEFFATPNPADLLLDPLVQFTDMSTGSPTSWNWNLGEGPSSTDQNPVHNYSDSGTFSITLSIENEFGCTDEITKTVYINPAFTFYVPNAFTPEADKANDLFKAYGLGIAEFEMVILDRWGSIVFRTQDLNEGWNGTILDTGKEVKQDIYTWQVNITDYSDYPHYFRGTVMLIR